MSDAWNEIVAAANVIVAKSADDSMTQERAIEKLLKTPDGSALYARYRAEGDSVEDLAKEEVVARTATIARNFRVSKEEALEMVIQRSPDLAAAAKVTMRDVEKQKSDVEKSAGSAWSRIEELAAARVEKSDDTITHTKAVDQVLKTPEGASLYSDYLAERADS
jgi:hypothetical protein